MKFTHVRYLAPGPLPEGALKRAALRLVGALNLDPYLLQVFYSTPDSHSVEPRTIDNLDQLSALSPGTQFALQAEKSQVLLRGTCHRTRIELRLSGPRREDLEAALTQFCEPLGLAKARCVALSLSGGGFRASLFHLGVIRFLAESGKLQDVTHICSVSGGSILAAHLVLNWERYTGTPEEFAAAAAEIIAFAKSDVRGRVFRRWFLGLVAFPVLRFWPWPWKKHWTRTVLLQIEYDRLYRHELLKSLGRDADEPEDNPRPEVFLLATAMKTGDMCTFTGRGLQFEQARLYGDSGEHHERPVNGTLLPVSFAVTASSAFPPVFPPLKVTPQLLRTDAAQFPHSPEYLSDGGVFDNLGIRKLQNLQSNTEFDLSALVVSDAEAPFVWHVGADYSAFWRRAVRSSDILMKRVANLEYDWAMHRHRESTLPVYRCSISEVVDSANALEPELVHATRQIRTDLDSFSDLEVSCLLKQGYMVARKTLLRDDCFADEQLKHVRERTKRPWDPTKSAANSKGDSGTTAALETSLNTPGRGGRSGLDAALGRGRPAAVVREEVDQVERSQRGSQRWLTAIFDPRDLVSWFTLGCLLIYATGLLGTWVYNFIRAKQATQQVAQVTQEKLGWQEDFETYRQTFQDRWSFQIEYKRYTDVYRRLSPEIRQIVDTPPAEISRLSEEQKVIYGSYQRLKAVAGTTGSSSQKADAYLSRHPILSGESQELVTGFISRFSFPGSEDKLLMQFSGRTTESALTTLNLEFFQYKLADAPAGANGTATTAPRQKIATFTVAFFPVSPTNYQGELEHPLLTDADGKKIGFASVRLWKPIEADAASTTGPGGSTP